MDDYPNERGRGDRAAAIRPRRWPLVLATALAGAGLALLYWRWVSPPEPAPAAPVAEPTPAPAEPSPTPQPAAALPPAEQTDTVVRDLLGRLLQSQKIESWLASGDLVRRFVSAVNAVADGEVPRTSLPFLAPQGAFTAATVHGRKVIDEHSYRRFTPFVEAVQALDPKAVAEAYARLSPLFESAHAEVGRPGTTFAATLSKAIARLVRVPVPKGPVEVVAPKVMFEFADPALEARSPAEKQLLRLGPANARAVQQKLAALAAAIGLPDAGAITERSPSPAPAKP